MQKRAIFVQVHAPKRRRKRKDALALQEDPDDFLLPEIAEKRQPTQLAGVPCVDLEMG